MENWILEPSFWWQLKTLRSWSTLCVLNGARFKIIASKICKLSRRLLLKTPSPFCPGPSWLPFLLEMLRTTCLFQLGSFLTELEMMEVFQSGFKFHHSNGSALPDSGDWVLLVLHITRPNSCDTVAPRLEQEQVQPTNRLGPTSRIECFLYINNS